jgi:hypothetical protein
MALKSILDSIDDLPPDVQSEYKAQKVGDKDVFVLDVEGLDAHPGVGTLKSAYERVKGDKKKLGDDLKLANTKLATFPAEFTVEEWDRLKAIEEAGPDDPEGKKRTQAELAAQKKNMEEKHTNEIKKKDEEIGKRDKIIADRDGEVGRLLIDSNLSTALTEAGVGKQFLRAATAMLRPEIKVTRDEETGQSRAFFDTDLGEIDIPKFVETWSKSDEGKAFIPNPTGGGAGGNQNNQNKSDNDNPFSEKFWSKTKQGALVKTDRPKAERLAKQAGFRDLDEALPAMRPAAKEKAS